MNFNMDNTTSIHIFRNPTMQSWLDLFFINEILTEHTHKFTTLIELGTYRGGLAVFLGLHALSIPGCEAITFDIRPEPEGFPYSMYKEMLPLTYYNLDVFTQEAKAIVRGKAREGRILLICDGGEKPQDFETYAPLVEGTDIILVHDKGKEIFQHEVDSIAQRNGLEPFYQEEADKIGCHLFSFIKMHNRRDPI